MHIDSNSYSLYYSNNQTIEEFPFDSTSNNAYYNLLEENRIEYEDRFPIDAYNHNFASDDNFIIKKLNSTYYTIVSPLSITDKMFDFNTKEKNAYEIGVPLTTHYLKLNSSKRLVHIYLVIKITILVFSLF